MFFYQTREGYDGDHKNYFNNFNKENQSACNYFFHVQRIEFFLIIDKIVNNEELMKKEKKE